MLSTSPLLRLSWTLLVAIPCGCSGGPDGEPPGDGGTSARTRPDASPPSAADASTDAGDAGVPRELVVVTSGSAAARAGVDVLAAGGNAMDAALTVALDQVVLTAGSWNSFAGILGLVYVDGTTGEMHTLHAGYRTFAGEVDALSIPAEDSGRTALVPGFMAGVSAAHERFGSVDFEQLFGPAIQHAEDGFVVDATLARLFAEKRAVLSLHEETAQVYLADGDVPSDGEEFRQPALAETLRAVAEGGARVMYEGPWAERFVRQVRASGGAATMEDLASYAPRWGSPSCFAYGAHEICTLDPPDSGGVALTESMLLADVAGLRDMGSFREDPDALYWLLRSQQLGSLMTYLPEYLPEDPTFLTDRLTGVGPSFEERLRRSQAEAILRHIETGRFDQVVGEWARAFEGASMHSDGIVVRDRDGNLVALTHTINTSGWGATGLNVGGVSIPDSASFQQGAVHLAGPGEYLPAILNPTVVRQDGEAVLAATTIGNPHVAMFSHLHGILDLGLELDAMVAAPIIDGPAPFQETAPPGAIDAAVLAEVAARGLRVSEEAGSVPLSFWLGVGLTERRGWIGAATPSLSLIGGGVYTRP